MPNLRNEQTNKKEKKNSKWNLTTVKENLIYENI